MHQLHMQRDSAIAVKLFLLSIQHSSGQALHSACCTIRAQPVVAARFCPVLFAATPPAAPDTSATAVPAAPAPAAPAGGLPYRLVLAVATLDSIVRWPPHLSGLHSEPGLQKAACWIRS